MQTILNLTRKVHQLAVKLHVKALRVQVQITRAIADAEHEAALTADAVADRAHQLAQEALDKAVQADQHADIVEHAAAIEAQSIGGQL